MIINLAKIRFGGGASAKPEDSFQETYTANGSYDITPEAGHVFSGGHVEVDVHPTDKLTRTYTENNTYEISGEWTNAEITVAVPGPVEETFDITPTNSDITVVPTVADNVFSGGVVRGYDVDPIYNALEDLNTGDPVPPVTPFVVPDGIKFSKSSVSSFPSSWDWSQVTDFSEMFNNCYSLTSILQLNTSNATNMFSMFSFCSSLTSVPQMDTSNVTKMNQMFRNCSSLTSVPQMDTSKVEYMDNMFNGCSSLQSVDGINFSFLTSKPNYFFGNSTISSLTHFIVNGSINFTWSDDNGFYRTPNLDYESIKSILEAMNRTTNTDQKTMKFNQTIADQNGELAGLVSACTTKGWTVEGLTIN